MQLQGGGAAVGRDRRARRVVEKRAARRSAPTNNLSNDALQLRSGVENADFFEAGFQFDKERRCNSPVICYLEGMSTVQELEATIPRLSRAELEQFRAWFEDYIEDRLELTDEVKAQLDQSRREIADGNYTTRQPE